MPADDMQPRCMSRSLVAAIVLVAPLVACELEPGLEAGSATAAATLPQTVEFANPSGRSATFNVNGTIDLSDGNPFFASFGSNERTCGSCHVPSAGWSITPSEVRARFDATDGFDPIFALVDGADSPAADVSTLAARREAYGMLLTKGLIRVGLPVPPGAEFELVAVDDPYGWASAAQLSLFRRPLPTANLRFLSAVMWDGRESTPLVDGFQTADMLAGDLRIQANSATRDHAEALEALSEGDRAVIVAFQLGLFTAQIHDRDAGYLDERDGDGGPRKASQEPTWFGINDVLGGDPTGAPFDPEVFRVYDEWSGATGKGWAARRAIARGQALFNTRTFAISGVRGVNDVLGVASLAGTCTTCHDTPGAGNHSTRLPLDLGLTDADRRTPDLPLYTLRNRTTGEEIQTTDPGRAMITGRWADVALFKGPILRGLAARPPYFHNGSAATLADVVAFYDERFAIGLTASEAADLAAFLDAL